MSNDSTNQEFYDQNNSLEAMAGSQSSNQDRLKMAVRETKRKAGFLIGTVLVIVSAILGSLFALGAFLYLFLFDGIGGATKTYPDGAAYPKFLLTALFIFVPLALVFLLGRHLRQNNEKIDI